MKKITNDTYQETYFEETLENGLHVILWNKPGFEKSYFMIATPLGALDMEQVDEAGKEIAFPAGIAHFLEHKMFEDETCDIMDKFSKMGANVNAFTSYTETAYYFSTSGDPIKPLHLLLELAQNLHISEASVEKEKGIIIQELNMYKQMSDSRLLMETFTSLFAKHPLRFDIGGDDESVTSITYDQLQECYRLNYHPSKMILIGVSGHDPKKLIEEIRNDQSQREFPKVAHVTRKSFDEPREVARSSYSFEMDVTTPKLAVAYKLAGIADWKERLKLEWAFRILLDASFTSLNPDYQKWLDEKIINDYFGYDADFGSDYGFLMFYNETDNIEQFRDFIHSTLKKVRETGIQEATLNQLKRRYFGQSVRSLNNFDEIAVTYMRNYFSHIDFFETMDMATKITLDDLWRAMDQIDPTCVAVVTVLPKK